MRWTAIALLVVAACDRSPEPRTEPQNDKKVADDIAQTAQDLLAQPPEPLARGDKQDAIDPAAIVGTWRIKHLIYITDGKPKEPEPPLVDGTWTFEAGGRYLKRGGNELEGTFVLTKSSLKVSALGPVLEYSVDKLTADELVVTQMIMPDMGTSVVLERAK